MSKKAIKKENELRDYFASKFTNPPVSYKPANLWQWIRWVFNYNYKGNSRPHDENARQAYQLANAMIKERKLHV